MNRQINFKYVVILLLLGLPGFQNMALCQKKLPSGFCITEDESKLYSLVNEYRKAMNLSAIPLSKSLCYVAKAHLDDLIQNKPDTSTCSFHSWSNKGKWTSCCYQKEKNDQKCMQLKPQELTNYPGKAYEIVYWESKDATPDFAFNQWREIIASRSMLINSKEWEKFSWNAVGVGMMGSFAVVWFGEELDVEKETKVCGKNIVIANNPPTNPNEPQIVTSAANRFYLIFGNFNSITDAKSQAIKYIDEGFKKTKIISKDNKFRISLSDYSSKELANQGKKELPAKYKDAWIMPF
ncbi:MAG: SPOR domain-containing protein [Bacteroidales bacterium]|nr:SPOR domain-containing protein [Bacteroidales bacterium]